MNIVNQESLTCQHSVWSVDWSKLAHRNYHDPEIEIRMAKMGVTLVWGEQYWKSWLLDRMDRGRQRWGGHGTLNPHWTWEFMRQRNSDDVEPNVVFKYFNLSGVTRELWWSHATPQENRSHSARQRTETTHFNLSLEEKKKQSFNWCGSRTAAVAVNCTWR